MLVIESFNHTIYLTIANKTYTGSELLSHELISETFDDIVDGLKEKSPISHRKHTRGKNNPLKRYLSKIGKSLAEYKLEKASSF